MTHGFQQQDCGLNFSFPKSAPTQQHGGKTAGKAIAPSKPSRAFEPRPGH